MSDIKMEDLPDWIWGVVAAIQKYDEEHPKLWREAEDGRFVPTACLDGPLLEMIPADVKSTSAVLAKLKLRERS